VWYSGAEQMEQIIVVQTMEQAETLLNSPTIPSTVIADVYTVNIKAYADERGRFMETFRQAWFPQVSWDKIQNNRSDSKPGVLRGLHYHFHQIDYWYVPKGIIRAAMVDLRSSSPTYRATQVIEIGEEHNTGVFIPVGVAHGFYALTECTLMYIVNNYYDASDERGVAWDDPDLGVDWGLNGTIPVLSPRDQGNRRLRDIPANELPG
jgi:dTDP-4-dehydrorhamnose 3,5-epimerase